MVLVRRLSEALRSGGHATGMVVDARIKQKAPSEGNQVDRPDMAGRAVNAIPGFSKGVEKRHERRQDKAKFGEKAEMMGDN